MVEVLVVDDEPAIRHLLQTLLALEGYTVRTAATGEEALRQVDRCAPAVLVLDLRLPGRDGWAVAHELDARQLATQVVVFTAAPWAARTPGHPPVARVLTKPLDIEVMVETIARLAPPTA